MFDVGLNIWLTLVLHLVDVGLTPGCTWRWHLVDVGLTTFWCWSKHMVDVGISHVWRWSIHLVDFCLYIWLTRVLFTHVWRLSINLVDFCLYIWLTLFLHWLMLVRIGQYIWLTFVFTSGWRWSTMFGFCLTAGCRLYNCLTLFLLFDVGLHLVDVGLTSDWSYTWFTLVFKKHLVDVGLASGWRWS